MSSSSFVFPGYPSYLHAAAEQLDRPEAARGAGRLVALTALANLCAQASRAEPAQVDAILLKAIEFRDQIAVAHRAADAMLAAVEGARIVPEPGPEPGPDSPARDFPAAPSEGWVRPKRPGGWRTS